MKIWCCGCGKDVDAVLTSGVEIYPHRPDLHDLPFWICTDCGNFVGCHHKARNRTRPLGVIPTPEIKAARQHIHAILDPIWQSGRISRTRLYRRISDELGHEFHTAEMRSLEEGRRIYRIIQRIARS